MTLFLTLLSGISWMLVYIDCIRLGIKQKTYGIPLFALALNIAWEGLYSFFRSQVADKDSDYCKYNLVYF